MNTIVRNSYTPKARDYCNKIVIDNDKQVKYIFDSDGVYTAFKANGDIEKIAQAILEEAKDYSDQGVAQAEQYTRDYVASLPPADSALYLYPNVDVLELAEFYGSDPALSVSYWNSELPDQSYSIFQLEDGTPYSLFDLYDAIESGRRIVFVGPNGLTRDETTGDIDLSTAITSEIVARAPIPGIEDRAMYFAIATPHIPDAASNEVGDWNSGLAWNTISFEGNEEAMLYCYINYFKKAST